MFQDLAKQNRPKQERCHKTSQSSHSYSMDVFLIKNRMFLKTVTSTLPKIRGPWQVELQQHQEPLGLVEVDSIHRLRWNSLRLRCPKKYKNAKASSAHGCWRLVPGTLQKYKEIQCICRTSLFLPVWLIIIIIIIIIITTITAVSHTVLMCPTQAKQLSWFSQTPSKSSSKKHENASKSKCIEHTVVNQHTKPEAFMFCFLLLAMLLAFGTLGRGKGCPQMEIDFVGIQRRSPLTSCLCCSPRFAPKIPGRPRPAFEPFKNFVNIGDSP